VLAIMGLRARAGIIAANLASVAANTEAVERLIAAHPGTLAWTPPQAGSVALASFDVEGGATAACERLAAEAGVMLLPSSVFDFGDRHVRFGLGRADLSVGLAALDRWLSDNGL
jgi:aspartate/methionine/tyrosine aminotransferase